MVRFVSEDRKTETQRVECDCPADSRIATFFDRRSPGRRSAGQRYSMAGVSQALLAALRAAEPAGRTILELGCGAGALLTELLLAGPAQGSGLHLSAAAITG